MSRCSTIRLWTESWPKVIEIVALQLWMSREKCTVLDIKLIDFFFCRFGREGVLPASWSTKMPGLRERGGRNLWLILTAAPPCVRKFSHARFSNSPQCHSHRSAAYMNDGGSFCARKAQSCSLNSWSLIVDGDAIAICAVTNTDMLYRFLVTRSDTMFE